MVQEAPGRFGSEQVDDIVNDFEDAGATRTTPWLEGGQKCCYGVRPTVGQIPGTFFLVS